MSQHSPTNTASSTATIGARFTMKSLNVRPPRLAMMMFGGSPISVEVPPMLLAITSAIRNGTGEVPSRSQMSSVTGATSSTVVTLSRNAESTAVISDEHDHDQERAPFRPFRGPDRQVLEHAALLQDADDDHHAQQQEDDVPVDAAVFGEEDRLVVGRADEHHQRGTHQRDGDPRHLLGGDEDVGAGEDRESEPDLDGQEDAPGSPMNVRIASITAGSVTNMAGSVPFTTAIWA